MSMDLIEKLETRITGILEQLDTLKAENARLAAEVDSGRESLEEENRRLSEELDQEKAAKSAVLEKIDKLLAKIDEHSTK
jgi:cell division protein ZapB